MVAANRQFLQKDKRDRRLLPSALFVLVKLNNQMERPSCRKRAFPRERNQVLSGPRTGGLLIKRGPARTGRYRGHTSVVALGQLKRPHLAFRAVVVVAAAALISRRAGASAGSLASTTECIFSSALDELGAGDHVVTVGVSNTFHGVPAADANCPSGEHIWAGLGSESGVRPCDNLLTVLVSVFCPDQMCDDEIAMSPVWAVG